eukprot:CAMPEP_0198343920 /NCGR_PEP_ID=MMETSP1450-20131203/63785_1 /TAXON_ID=753684 ORGANISM="Madagascaria erythrocladiodes, Strain CCMP3234" /NCGR_SAMPLE_ID=MMETSP1450 /ASSEMBLY_ACC=CAM_ASM_001115 /LENGTH=47 /DNA_ID= /DNA_START= /DNA_END= /DNA_ORIENTATION=
MAHGVDCWRWTYPWRASALLSNVKRVLECSDAGTDVYFRNQLAFLRD